MAVIRDINIRNLKRISALVLLDHKEANPVEFSLGAISHRERLTAPEALPKIWTRVEPQIFSEVQGSIDTAGDSKVDIFFATRMADDADPTVAWAFFKRIEVTF